MDKPKRNTLDWTLGSLLIGALFGTVIVTGFLAAHSTGGIVHALSSLSPAP